MGVAMRMTTWVAALLMATPAIGGSPVEETIVCPVGGESFTITGTLSCSTRGRTLSLKPITTCDFVDRLPVCPGNGLPLYDRFTDDELARLGTYLSGEEFAAIAPLPPWQRAYALNQYLR
ncbi:MAG: hypothetical protein AAF761_06380, partial [Pseudomonadota bacterium]